MLVLVKCDRAAAARMGLATVAGLLLRLTLSPSKALMAAGVECDKRVTTSRESSISRTSIACQ